ncbi:saccharopine dehydrogenase family protein [Lentzea xinjiangensis]|nr:saccharopine dehydrogenase NADP-binding domain-containing protein [Lentzea xinjiangensis]
MCRARKVWELLVGPVLAGALVGLTAGVSTTAYVFATAVSTLGGLPAGAQHRTWSGALARGGVTRTLWASAVIGTHLTANDTAIAPLPDPVTWYLVLGSVPACITAVAVWFVAARGRRHAQPRALPPPPVAGARLGHSPPVTGKAVIVNESVLPGASPAEPVASSRLRHDVVLHGATGFVGRLTAKHLASAAPGADIALAGRDEDKLLALRDELGVRRPVIALDLGDGDAVEELATSTRAVASTVGRHGLPLALACARQGTSYADLSGEVPFVRRSIAELHDIAVETGARIVHACGFEAIPSDIGTFLLADRARADDEGGLTDTVLILESFKGGMSAGNLDSNHALAAALEADPALRDAIADPWALAATPRKTSTWDEDPRAVFKDRLTGRWLAPALGGPFNSRLVRRSDSLTPGGYGEHFRYREGMGVGTSPVAYPKAVLVKSGLSLMKFLLTSRSARPVMTRILPPGSGPSEELQRNGHFRVAVHTRTSTGARYTATVAAKADPGYAATSTMLGQSALSLATDRLTARGGVLTPSVAMGHHLVNRLSAQGFEISVERERADADDL